MSKLIYLAGPIDGLSYDEATDWRKDVIKELEKEEIIGLSPMRCKYFLKGCSKLTDKISDNALTSDSGITTRDLWDIERSDAVLFNLLNAKKVSIGTMIEYGAAGILNKLIIRVMEKGNIHEHAMVRRLSAYHVDTLDKGIRIAKSLFDY